MDTKKVMLIVKHRMSGTFIKETTVILEGVYPKMSPVAFPTLVNALQFVSENNFEVVAEHFVIVGDLNHA